MICEDEVVLYLTVLRTHHLPYHAVHQFYRTHEDEHIENQLSYV